MSGEQKELAQCWLDAMEPDLSYECKRCALVTEFPNTTALAMAKRAVVCESCRLRETIQLHPGLAVVVLDAFQRIRPPAGDSWMEVIPDSLLNAYGFARTEMSEGELRRLFGIDGQ